MYEWANFDMEAEYFVDNDVCGWIENNKQVN